MNVSLHTKATPLWVTLACCALAALCEGFDLQAAGVAAAGIRAEFHPSSSQLTWFFSASTLGLVIGALIGGRLSDAFGRKPVLVTSITIFGLFSLVNAAAWDVSSLTLVRLLTGLGLGGALPNLVALVNESSTPERRAANVALVYSGVPFGGAFASVVSLATDPANWRVIFIVGGVVPLLIAPILHRFLRESAVPTKPPSTPQGEDVLAARTAGYLAVLSSGRAVPTLLLWTSFFVALLTLYLLLSWLPTLLVTNGLTPAQASGAQVAFNVGGGLSAILTGRLLDSRLRGASVVAIFTAMPALLFLLARAPSVPALIAVIVFLLGCAVIGAQSFLYADSPRHYPDAIRGVGVGCAVAMGRLGSVVGPALGGVLLSTGRNSSQLMMSILPLVIIGSVLAVTLALYRPQRPAKP
jgi:AAHS family 3-hydroxyphenylpropionic acid transporter